MLLYAVVVFTFILNLAKTKKIMKINNIPWYAYPEIDIDLRS